MKKVILVGGCFDILHWGHIAFLKKAKSLGSYLVVALESDENTRKLKGPGRPIHTQVQRKKMLESLRFVDKVIILSDRPDYRQLVLKVKPDIVAVAAGGKQNTYGVKKVVMPKIKTSSTTQIAKLLSLEQN